MTDPIQIVLAAHRVFPEPCTLLVDADLAPSFKGEFGVACLSQIGLAPEEMWACRGAGRMNLVVLSAPRTAREMFRVLSLVERLVAPKGKILLLPVTDSASEEVRPEATEIFCGVHPEWSRRQIEGNVVELWRHGIPPAPKGKFLSAEDVAKFAAMKDKDTPAPGKRVVSLSVFGDCRFGTDFWKDMPKFTVNYVLAHHALFPGWDLRIHHDEHLYHANGGDVLCGLARRGLVRLVFVPSRPGQGKTERMLHRLMPVWDPEVKYVVCRDVDSLPTWRDRCCVEEFIASGHPIGVIHDNREHGRLMGGLTQFHAVALREIYSTFEEFLSVSGFSDEDWNKHGADQIHLNTVMLEFSTRMEFPDVLEHSLRSRGVRTITGSDFRTEIATPSQFIRDSVSLPVREGSDALTNYMGSSGYDTARARVFYDVHSPVAAAVREAEAFVGGMS